MEESTALTTKDTILDQLYTGEISTMDAFKALEPEPSFKGLKKAHFIKFQMKLPNESKAINALFKVLFALPLPISIGQFVLSLSRKKTLKSLAKMESEGKVNKNSLPDIQTIDELQAMLRYAKNTTIEIDSDDAKIKIKIR